MAPIAVENGAALINCGRAPMMVRSFFNEYLFRIIKNKSAILNYK